MANIDLDSEPRGLKEWEKNYIWETTINNQKSMETRFQILYTVLLSCEGAESESLDPTTCVGACVWPGLFLFFCLAIMLATFLLESLHIERMVRVNVYRYHYLMRGERAERAEI